MPIAVLEKSLKTQVVSILRKQGYTVKKDGSFALREEGREAKRKAHEIAKLERIKEQKHFILRNAKLIEDHLIDGADLDVSKIQPRIIEVKEGSVHEKMFRWWNFVWWSLPYERAYGRQMRFLIWDDYHDACIGLVGLQSPILSWGVRDEYLSLKHRTKVTWVNQSLNAQRIGALPPYNKVLGGKLVALLMTSDVIRKKFTRKYKGQKTVLKKRRLPPRLLFITTTGAYGKSSIYSRLKFSGQPVAIFIGYTQGTGTFHIPNGLYNDLLLYLKKKGVNTKRGYGTGPSRKMRLIDEALCKLDFSNGTNHGIKRAVYLFPVVSNLKDVISKGSRPKWTKRKLTELTEYWKTRWALKRIEHDKSYLDFRATEFLSENLEYLKTLRK